jgi:hypothetical protein
MEAPRKRALVGECISRASVEAVLGVAASEIDVAIAACDYERAATIAFAHAKAGSPVTTETIARILPGIELPAITCSLIAIAPERAKLLDVVAERRFPTTKDAAELEAIALYAAWKAGADTKRLIPELRRLSARSLSAESYALLATIAASIDDPNVAAATKPIAPFSKEYAKNVAADDKAMHATLAAVLAELPATVEASAASGFTVRAAKQVGRNEPCPCGSGQKFKKCCADKPQAQPSPIPGLSYDEFLTTGAGRMEVEHLDLLPLRDLVRIELKHLSHVCLRGTCRRFIEAHEWTHAERVLDELATRKNDGTDSTNDDGSASFVADDFRWELVAALLDARQRELARAQIARLPPDLAGDFETELAITGAPEPRDPAWTALVAHARRNLASTDKLDDTNLAYSMLRAEPALGIYFARACIGTLHVDDADTLLDAVEEARDMLNLPPVDPAWAVLDEVSEKEDAVKPAVVALDSQLAESTARIDQLERTLATLRGELADARTRPAAELMRAPESAQPSGLESKVRELEALIREGNSERRDLRKQLDAAKDEVRVESERRDDARSRRATLDEPDEGFDAPLELGNREVTIPRFERRFVDALAEVPNTVAAETMRTVGTLSAGDGFAWRGVKQAKDMARQVLMQRVGIHHRLIFRVENGALEVLDLVTREQLLTTLKRLRANR